MQIESIIIKKTIENKRPISQIVSLTEKHHQQAMKYHNKKKYYQANLQRRKSQIVHDPQCTFKPKLIKNKYNKQQQNQSSFLKHNTSVQVRLIQWGRQTKNSKMMKKTNQQAQQIKKFQQEREKVIRKNEEIFKETKKVLYNEPKNKIFGLKQYYHNKSKAQIMKTMSYYLFRLDRTKY